MIHTRGHIYTVGKTIQSEVILGLFANGREAVVAWVAAAKYKRPVSADLG